MRMRLPTAEEASIAACEAAEDAQAWLAAEHYGNLHFNRERAEEKAAEIERRRSTKKANRGGKTRKKNKKHSIGRETGLKENLWA